MPLDQPCTQAACAGVAWLPCRLCTGSRQGRRPRQCRRQGICTRLPQRPYPLHGSDATRWAVTAHRSDGPADASNNTGESLILLRAAYMMMPALHWLGSCQDRWASYIGTPTAQVSASAGPLGWNRPRYAQARAAYQPHPWAEPSSSARSNLFPRPRRTVPRGYRLCAMHRTAAAFLIPLTS